MGSLVTTAQKTKAQKLYNHSDLAMHFYSYVTGENNKYLLPNFKLLEELANNELTEEE